jgi:exodeoxyribonuclease V alpha subunit
MSTSPSTSPISKDRLAQLLANMRAKKAEALAVAAPTVEPSGPTPEHSEALGDSAYQLDKHGQIIHYNTKQQEFVTLAGSGKDAILIGAAGTGKTTCMKGTVQALIQNGIVGILQAAGHKHLLDGTPGLVICAYTRRAVNNIRKNLSTDVQANCITIHKLLEYQPVYYEVSDPMTGDTKTKMNFEPTRNQMNPLPSSIRTIIFEESSMIGTDLYKEVINACPHNPQLIFLGDIQQLSPVFGPAILGFKLLSLPVVELTEVYRQALESPIISLAHRILSGNTIPLSEFEKWKFPQQLTIHPWKKKITPDLALNTAGQFFIAAQKSGAYDPEEDMILLPFNKSFGTIELNKIIANQLAKNREAMVHEVVSGFMKHYFSIGDKVLFDKEDAVIINIEANPAYTGAKALPASTTLDYWGYDPVVHEVDQSSDVDMDFLLSQVASSSDADRVHQASHTITLRMLDSEVEIKVDKASALNAMLLGYALTVHKSQGSEWRKVFCVFHQSHATMLQRELLYTAITRAKEELYIICEPETFVNGINSQKIKGETIAEKAEFFKGKVTEGVDYE